MEEVILVNDSGVQIDTIEQAMEYVVESLDNSAYHVENLEETFYAALLDNDIIEDDKFRVETLRDCYKVLKVLEPGYWHIEK